jgi:hypothetical protein
MVLAMLGMALPACAQYQAVSGTVLNPDGTPFTGSFLITLTKSSVVNTCTTPASVVPMPGVTVKVTGGTFPSTNLLPTSCLSPRLPYFVQVKDSLNRPVYSDNWYITQTPAGTVNVGTLGDVQLASGITVSVPLAIIGTPTGNQTITQPGGTSLTVNSLIVSGSLSVTGTFSATTLSASAVSASTSVTTPTVTATTVTASGTVQGATVNATSGFTVAGTPLSAAMLSNGVSGTGAVCLATGSACSPSSLFYQTIYANGTPQTQRAALNFSSRFVLTDSSSYTTADLNAPGSGNYTVTYASSPGSSTALAQLDGSGNIGPAAAGANTTTSGYLALGGGIYEEWVQGAVDTGSSELTQTINLPHALSTACYNVQATTWIAAASNSIDAWYQVVSCSTTQVVVQRQGAPGAGWSQNTWPQVFVIGR